MIRIPDSSFPQPEGFKPQEMKLPDEKLPVAEDTVTLLGNETMQVSFPEKRTPDMKEEAKNSREGTGTAGDRREAAQPGEGEEPPMAADPGPGEEEKLGSDPCSTGIRSMNDPCSTGVRSLNDPCSSGIQSLNDPCSTGIRSMNDPCSYSIRSVNDPCSYSIRSVNDPCAYSIRTSHPCSTGLR